MAGEQHDTVQITYVERTASTAALALQQLQAGRRLPLAVAAAQQSAGKGQAGRVWVSPRGNLYLSLILQPRVREGLSLLVAALLCEWLHEQGIAASCKWPNDILVQGKKLAGVLCEGALQGTQWRYVNIGIGLNVNVVPPELQAQATSMVAEGGRGGDVKQYAQQLTQLCTGELGREWSTAAIIARFERFTSAATELWCHAERFYLRSALSTRGHLRLHALVGEETQELVSSVPAYRLVYQQPYRYPLLVADIGNSSLKLVLFQPDGQEIAIVAKPNTRSIATALRQLRQALTLVDRWVIYAMSVNHHHRDLLQVQAEQHNFVLLPVAAKPFRYRGTYRVEQLGGDRLAVLEAYLAHYHSPATAGEKNMTGIVVDFGTATTIDIIVAGEHRGGYILPGLATSLQGLSACTDLPALDTTRFQDLRRDTLATGGINTESAIIGGVLRSQLELVRSLQRDFAPTRLVISGGLGKYAHLQLATAEYEPLLVAKGIRQLVLR